MIICTLFGLDKERCECRLNVTHLFFPVSWCRYMQCGCAALRLVVRNFSSVVRQHVQRPVTRGVDIPHEERAAKCLAIHGLLLDVRAFLLKRQTLQGRLGAAFRDLHALMQRGLD